MILNLTANIVLNKWHD